MLRLLTLFLLATFALPSCLTMQVWQRGRPCAEVDENGWSFDVNGRRVDGSLGRSWAVSLSVDERGGALAIDTEHESTDQGKFHGLTQQPALRWLLLRPDGDSRVLEVLAGTEKGDGSLPHPIVLRDFDAAGTACTLVLSIQDYQVDALPEELWDVADYERHSGFYRSFSISVPCHATWQQDAPPSLHPWPLTPVLGNRVVYGRPPPFGARLADTPLALLGDALLLPFELLFLPTWL